MAKRFTDSGKWQDKWFRRLPSKMKLLWCFMLDSCDNAGVFEMDLDLFRLLTGEEVSEEEFRTTFSGRVTPIAGSEKVWIQKFVFFQYGTLSEDSRPHISVLESLKKHGVFKEYLKGIDTTKDKDKEKDKDKDKRGSAEGGSLQAQFNAARKAYLGSNNGPRAEWKNFSRKYGTEAAAIVPLLLPAVTREIAHKAALDAAGQFVPAWKNFQTWINQRCWEQELGETGPTHSRRVEIPSGLQPDFVPARMP